MHTNTKQSEANKHEQTVTNAHKQTQTNRQTSYIE